MTKGGKCLLVYLKLALVNDIIRMIKARRMRWTRHIERMRYEWNAYRILMGKPEGKLLLGRPTSRPRLVDNVMA
jgi:hypothetical protein